MSEPKPEVIGEGAEDPSIELTFADLKFDIEIGKTFERSFLPEKVKALEGKEIALSGYMRPSFKATGINAFVFVRDTKENCFGPTAAIYDSMMAQMKKGTQTDYLARPLRIRGTFFLEDRKGPDGKPWAIYNMKNTTIEPTLVDSAPFHSKIQDRNIFINELRKYQENFKNRFEIAMKQRQELEDEHNALKLQGEGNIHAVMVVEIAKSIQSKRTELGKLQNERSKNERAEAAGADAVKARVFEIQQNAPGSLATALKIQILEAKANAELLRLKKLGMDHPDFELSMAKVKIFEQQLAALEKEIADPAADNPPEVYFALKKVAIERSIEELSRSIAEQSEQWHLHNREAIKLSKIQEKLKRLDIELEEIRASHRLGAELLLQLGASEFLK